VGATYGRDTSPEAKRAPKELEYKPKRAPSKHHDDANDGRHDRSDREKSFRSEISENESGIPHGSGLPRIKMMRRKNGSEGSSGFTTPDVRTARVEVSRFWGAGYNRWNGMGASIFASDGNFVVIGQIEIVVQSNHAIGP
jgi:hypothetical protein